MISFETVCGALVWASLSGLFAGLGGGAPSWLDPMVGACLAFGPWAVLAAAGEFLQGRRRQARRMVLPQDATAPFLDAGRSLLVTFLVLAGLLAGLPAGPVSEVGRALGGLVAALPPFLVAWVLAVALGEWGSRAGWAVLRLRQAELAAAALGLGATVLGDLAQGGPLDRLGAWWRLTGTGSWVGPASAGRFEPDALVLVGCLLVALQGLWSLLGAPAGAPDRAPEPPPGAALPMVAGRPAATTRFVWRCFLLRWGWPGIPAALLLVAATSWHARNLPYMGRLLEAGVLPTPLVVLGLQAMLALLVATAAPSWIPPAPPHARVIHAPAAEEEGDRAFAAGLLRLLAVVAGLGVALALAGVVGPLGVQLVVVEAGVMGLPALGLAVLAARHPSGGVVGAAVYLAGLVLLVLPHLFLDAILAALMLGGPDGVRLLFLGWLGLKGLGIVISSTYGAYLTLVYSQEWRQEDPWSRATSRA